MNRAVMKYEDYKKFKVGNLVTLTSFSSNQVIEIDVWGKLLSVNCPREAPLSGMIVRIERGEQWERWVNSLDVLVDETVYRFYVTNALQLDLQKAQE